MNQVSDGDIAESLNDFFVNIGSSIERKIPKTSTPFSSYLKEPNNKLLFLVLCIEIEILSIINNMKISKSCGPNGISTS